MSARPAISVKVKVSAAIAQATGGWIICPLCSRALGPDEPRILEHLVARAFTGSDEVRLLAWVHKPCADLKTYGNKATCADGDIHRIAKAKRIARGGKTVRRPMPKTGRKIQSRGFEKREKRI